MACTCKSKNAASSGTVSTVYAVPLAAGADTSTAAAPAVETAPSAAQADTAAVSAAQTDTAAETADTAEADAASSWTEVPMRRYVHPIPAACTSQACACQSCACQSAEQTACLARLLRQQRAILEDIYALLMQYLPYL